MQRPDRLRVEVERSDGERGSLTYDGRWLTAFNATENVYARTGKGGQSRPGAGLHRPRPEGRHFRWRACSRPNFPRTWRNAPRSVTLVEVSTLFDVPTDHLAIRTQEVDLQLWIAQGPEPLPRRVVITYKNAPGEPQFRADLFDWKIAPRVDAAEFQFVPAGRRRASHAAGAAEPPPPCRLPHGRIP